MALKSTVDTGYHTTLYNGLKGVDFSSGDENVYYKHSPSAVNMISDVGGRPKKRRGWERLITGDYELLQMWSFAYNEEEHLIVHYHDLKNNTYSLRRVVNIGDTYSFIGNHICSKEVIGFFTANDLDSVFNIITENNIYEYVYDNGEYVFRQNAPYVPTIIIGGAMKTGGGTVYESVNILTNEVKESFLGLTSYKVTNATNDSREYDKATILRLTRPIDKTKPITVTVSYAGHKVTTTASGIKAHYWGTSVEGGERYERTYEYDPQTAKWTRYGADYVNVSGSEVKSTIARAVTTEISFNGTQALNVPEHVYYPIVEGEDNVSVQYYMNSTTTSKAKNALLSCTQSALYENRVWLSGAGGEYNNRIWYSSSILDHNAYYPDVNYVVVGSNDTGIKGLCNLGSYLGVIKSPSLTETTVHLLYSTTFNDNTTYATKSFVSGVGALSDKTFCNADGETLFLAQDGINALSTSAIKNRSYYLNKKLLAEPNLENATATVFNGYYILAVNDHCYILDTRQKGSYGTEWTNFIYECYYWENVPAISFASFENELWFIHRDGHICRFRSEESRFCYRDDVDTPIYCEWSTPLDNDGSTQLYKTLQKKGTVATIAPFSHTSAQLYINVDDAKLIYIGKQDCDLLDFNDIRFDDFSFVSNESPFDMFFKKKVKKYKRLQFIVKNAELDEPFMIEEITKTFTVKGYSKHRQGDGINVKEK